MRYAIALLLIVASGCDAGSELRIQLQDPEVLAGIELDVLGRTIGFDEFESGRVVVDVPESGRLTIGIRLREGGQLAAEGSVEIPLQDDFEWGSSIFRRADDPSVGCFGCIDTVRIPIEEEFQRVADEALWFSYGGKRRGSDVVF